MLPHWGRKGEVLYWQTDRQGLRAHANEGRQTDVYAAFLTRKAWDRWKLDEAAYDQLVAKEKDAKGGKDKEKDKGVAGDAAPKPAEAVALELEHLDDRIARLSLGSTDLAGALLSPDGETLYYLARIDKGYDLWKYVPRKKEVKLVAKLGAQEADFRIDRDGKKAISKGGEMIHEVGTARMGHNDTDSVVNQYGQTWAVSNLFIMDGATLVSSPAKSPTLSIIALAWRSADNLATIAMQGAI